MFRVEVFATAAAPAGRLEEARMLCHVAFDGRFGADDWTHALGGIHAFGVVDDEVVAHAALVERRMWIGDAEVRAGYVEAVATALPHRRRGLGSAVMRGLQSNLATDFGIGFLSTGEHAFYEQLGWERWRGPTFVLTARGLVRTEDDDDGVLVWRAATYPPVRLDARLTCEERAGDDW